MKNIIVPSEIIENRIFMIRGKKVMFDRDLARLYGVKTFVLNQAVKRNKKRFPIDFMFQLNKEEAEVWRSQIVTSNSGDSLRSQNVILEKGRGHYSKYLPYVFTEQGVAMLSSVLRSERAIRVNIQIMRTFTKIREMIISNKALREKIEAMEGKYDRKFKVIFVAIRRLMEKDEIEPIKITGFRDKNKK
ncbi:MAG: ORF6N domain-containing protein [Parcubacteria group bacterium]|jgi:hypothetical protein